MRHVVGRHTFEHVLIRGGNVDLRKLRGQHTREVQVVALSNAIVARRRVESGEQHVAKDRWISVCREPDNLAFVTARLESERRGH